MCSTRLLALLSVVVSMVVLFQESAIAQTDLKAWSEEGDVRVPAPGEAEAFLKAHPDVYPGPATLGLSGGSVVDSFTDMIIPDKIKFGCRLEVDSECTGTYRIDAGSLYGLMDSYGVAFADSDNYWNGYEGDCPYSANAGATKPYILANGKLVFYVGNAVFTQAGDYNGAGVNFQLVVWEYAGDECTGTALRSSSDTSNWTYTYGCDNGDPCELETQHCLADGSLACTGLSSDPGDGCHLPDAPNGGFTKPGTGLYSYKTYVAVTIDPDSGNTFTDYEYGCTTVDWAN